MAKDVLCIYLEQRDEDDVVLEIKERFIPISYKKKANEQYDVAVDTPYGIVRGTNTVRVSLGVDTYRICVNTRKISVGAAVRYMTRIWVLQ